MGKIAVLFPYKEMVGIAREVNQKYDLGVDYIKEIQTVDTVNEARLAVESGARVIVARGYQAKLIRAYTNIPLVEVRFHAQEIGLLLMKAKVIVKKKIPRIGLIVFENMLCDMSHMEELFGVKLFISYIEKMEEVTERLYEMSLEEPDLIIGGDITCREAEKMGYPTLFYESTEESISEAMHAAKTMGSALEEEKQNIAQFETVLDTSFSGIVKINVEGKIIVINKLVENLIGKNAENVIGLPVNEIFPEFDMYAIYSILKGEREKYTISVNLRHQAWMLLIAPIQYDEKITGAILSLHKVSEALRRDSSLQRDMFLHGFVAQATFQHIYTENQQMRRVLERAKEYALSDSPVLIYGEEGTEFYRISEAIHNNSVRKSGPFVNVNTRGMDKEQQLEVFFGGEPGATEIKARMKGALVKANHGTIFIKGIEHLTLRVQHQIARTMLSRSIIKTDAQPLDNLDVRIMAHSKVNLQYLVKSGRFSEELFYLIQGLVLEIPSLNQRPEDLMYYFMKYFREYSQRYNKYLVLTEGAVEKIKNLRWKGNTLQLRAFCERLVLTSEKRSIDEVRIQKLHGELYPNISEVDEQDKIVVYKYPEAVELSRLLEKHHGNRNLVAQELNISTTTLWRRMKKYGIEAAYGKN
ncbi:MAG: sigma 54-interacting transcriptional regulator [Eubacteriales bacterium]|nr:sigma 54-interacting transcriptional regulator [Eubacteriales bacterium]